MRPSNKRGIAGERRPAEYQRRRFEIEDRLNEWLGARKNLGNLWGE